MPPRQPNGHPYTRLLSTLRKMELLHLCTEFRLPTDGPVVGLRTRLRDHMNINREALFANPRYRGLFPRHRRANNADDSSSSSTLTSRSPSPARSFASWDGIDDHHHHEHPAQPIQPLDHPQQAHVHPQPEASPPPSSSPGPSVAVSDHGVSPTPMLPIDGLAYLSLVRRVETPYCRAPVTTLYSLLTL